jgi:hypothetical protein
MSQRRLRPSQQKHELSRYLRQVEQTLYLWVAQVNGRIDPLTCRLHLPTASIYLPSRAVFEKIAPPTRPCGLVFADDSFLVFHELVTFGYRREDDEEPTVYRLRYGYHYQRPNDCYYFRYDHHPDIGDPTTHPPHHLHAAGWKPLDTEHFAGARHPVKETRLADVLGLIVNSFPSVKP